jgi:hypothetical protein
MFIATAITNASKLRRSEIRRPYTLRSYGAVKRKQPDIKGKLSNQFFWRIT